MIVVKLFVTQFYVRRLFMLWQFSSSVKIYFLTSWTLFCDNKFSSDASLLVIKTGSWTFARSCCFAWDKSFIVCRRFVSKIYQIFIEAISIQSGHSESFQRIKTSSIFRNTHLVLKISFAECIVVLSSLKSVRGSTSASSKAALRI